MNGGLFNDISVDEIRNVFGDGIGMRKCVVRIAGSQVFTTLFKMKHLKYNASIYERHFIPGVTPVNKSPVEFILNDKKEKIFTFLASEGMSTILGELAKEYPFTKPWRVVAGGPERQDSVWNGLQALAPATEIVAIQDGARPCTSAATPAPRR